MSALGWAGQVVDAAVLALLVILLRRLGRDPVAAWRARERALRAIFDDLRNLVAQAEGLARDLDDKLVARVDELRRLAAETAAEAQACDASPADDATAADVSGEEPTLLCDEVSPPPGEEGLALDLAARVRTLAQAGLAVEAIARRLDVPSADVRFLIALDEDNACADDGSMSFAFAGGSTSRAA